MDAKPQIPSKMAVHSAVVRHATWAAMGARARDLLNLLFAEAGGVEGYHDVDTDLFGRAILRTRRRADRLASMLGVSVRTVGRAIRDLVRVGWLVVTRTGRSSLFELVVPAPRVVEHGSGGARTPHDRPPPRQRPRHAKPEAAPASAQADDRDRVIEAWSAQAVKVGFGQCEAERLAGALHQHRKRARAAGLTPDRALNALEHVHEQIRRKGSGSSPGAVRSPVALFSSLILAGGCEPSRAAQRRHKQAAGAYATTASPAVGPGVVIDRTT